jgi:hypothetical protein
MSPLVQQLYSLDTRPYAEPTLPNFLTFFENLSNLYILITVKCDALSSFHERVQALHFLLFVNL